MLNSVFIYIPFYDRFAMALGFSYLSISAETLRRLSQDAGYETLFRKTADLLIDALAQGGKILCCGNGGSAADCQHLCGEMVVRFRMDRKGLPAIALTVDTSVLTAALNDYGPDPVFSRQVEALGRAGDVLWAFSTSGNSRNILLACETARANGMKILGFTGSGGGKLASVSDICFQAPSDVTSHIQECHIAAGHMLCGIVEEYFAGK